MATIFYGMSGEGRGHATRARPVVESLRRDHTVTVFAAACAHDLLAPLYAGSDVRVVRIPGLSFAYGKQGQVALLGTLASSARYRWHLGDAVAQVMPDFERERPDLVIADFEPILPRAARRCGVPFVSFDHQHYLTTSDLSGLPFPIRQQAAIIAPFVSALYDWQVATIVSSFWVPPRKPRFRNLTQVGVLIRPDMLSLSPHHGRHLLAYVRRHASPQFLAALAGSGREVRIYGLGAQASDGNLKYCAIDERRFIDDLAGCAAVVSTAGNQLVGEALHLGKPVLALPEPRNFEQSVNAYFLEQSRCGWVERGELTAARVRDFLDHADGLRTHIDRDAVRGNEAALAALEVHLHAPPVAALPPMSPVAGLPGAQWA